MYLRVQALLFDGINFTPCIKEHQKLALMNLKSRGNNKANETELLCSMYILSVISRSIGRVGHFLFMGRNPITGLNNQR
jgi:hypothetical protein